MWEIPFKAIGTFLSLLFAYLQVRSFIQGSHSTLKTDLEILNLLRTADPNHQSDPNYKAVKTYVDESIDRIYKRRQKSEKSKLYRDPDFIKGILIFPSFLLITLYLLKDGFTLWSLLSGFVALTGLGGVIGAVQRRRISHPKADAPSEPQDLSPKTISKDGIRRAISKSEQTNIPEPETE